jgi:F-type H+-transporting ATPase subunit b
LYSCSPPASEVPTLASSNFLVPNGTFVVELVAFLAVLGVLAKWVVPVVSQSMEQRQERIRQSLADAEETKRRAAEAEAEAKRVVSDAHGRARAVVDEAHRLAERLREERRQQAESEAERVLEGARSEIDAQARRAAEELRRQAADLAVSVVEKVLADGLDPQTHRLLIDRTLAELEAEQAIADRSGVGG